MTAAAATMTHATAPWDGLPAEWKANLFNPRGHAPTLRLAQIQEAAGIDPKKMSEIGRDFAESIGEVFRSMWNTACERIPGMKDLAHYTPEEIQRARDLEEGRKQVAKGIWDAQRQKNAARSPSITPSVIDHAQRRDLKIDPEQPKTATAKIAENLVQLKSKPLPDTPSQAIDRYHAAMMMRGYSKAAGLLRRGIEEACLDTKIPADNQLTGADREIKEWIERNQNEGYSTAFNAMRDQFVETLKSETMTDERYNSYLLVERKFGKAFKAHYEEIASIASRENATHRNPSAAKIATPTTPTPKPLAPAAVKVKDIDPEATFMALRAIAGTDAFHRLPMTRNKLRELEHEVSHAFRQRTADSANAPKSLSPENRMIFSWIEAQEKRIERGEQPDPHYLEIRGDLAAAIKEKGLGGVRHAVGQAFADRQSDLVRHATDWRATDALRQHTANDRRAAEVERIQVRYAQAAPAMRR